MGTQRVAHTLFNKKSSLKILVYLQSGQKSGKKSSLKILLYLQSGQ